MKRICLYSTYENNCLFNLDDPTLNRDNCLFSFTELKTEFVKFGYDLATQDINPKNESDIVIYLEMPKREPVKTEFDKSYLLLFESEVIRPDNWKLDDHENFNKIFTWHDGFIDNKKYFKINWSHRIPDSIADSGTDRKLCTLIAANKSVRHPLELYSKRREAIRWFERNHPEDFDLYGFNWRKNKKLESVRKYQQFSKVIDFVNNFMGYYPSYKGQVLSKNEVLKKYKYCICYENVRDIPGYITEKIFDCFFAGCIPIYWGANNIEQHIPRGTFIDKREFVKYNDLYEYINTLSNDEYDNYIGEIKSFLRSPKIYPFSADHFAKTIVTQILIDCR